MKSRTGQRRGVSRTVVSRRLLPRREEEALWECRHFGQYLRISVRDVARLFDAVGLRSPDQRPTALAKFLELTYGKVIVDPKGQEVIWHRWYRDRTLRFIAKQPGAGTFFADLYRRRSAS